MNMLNYKNFRASVEYSDHDALLVGRVLDIEALILFSADSVPALKKEMELAIEDYLSECARAGVEAQKPYKGTFNVRVGPECHRQAARTAAAWGITLNEFIRIAVEQAVDRHRPEAAASSVALTSTTFTSRAYEVDLPAASGRPMYN